MASKSTTTTSLRYYVERLQEGAWKRNSSSDETLDDAAARRFRVAYNSRLPTRIVEVETTTIETIHS